MKNKKTYLLLLQFFTILLMTSESLPQTGQLDPTFGQGGIVNTSLNVIGNSISNSVAIQNDGKVIAAGYTNYGTGSDFAVVRYNDDGSLDNSFGTNGIVQTSIGSFDDIAYSAAIQDDGKIVVCGYSNNGEDFDLAVVRYNNDGSLDDLFGTSGIITTPIETNSDDVALSLAIQNNGKIVLAGFTDDGTDADIIVARYNSNGFIDNTFGVNGIITTSTRSNTFGSFDETAFSVAIQNDGKIIVGGFSNNGNDNDMVIVRYNPNGTIDNTFGTNGIVITPVGNSQDEIHSIAIQDDGKIVAAGYSTNQNDNDFALVRYTTDGELDSTFGISGIVTTPVSGFSDYILSIAIQSGSSQEKIITAGYSLNSSGASFAIACYNNDGSLDSSFGTNGIALTPIGVSFSGGSVSQANSVAIQPDGAGVGKIVAAGFYYDNNREAFALARYDSIGELDNTFGINGIVNTPVGSSDDVLYSITIQTDGKIVAVGHSNTGTDNDRGRDLDFAIVRYSPDGILDNTFGSGGIVTTEIDSSFDEAFSVGVQNDDKIIAVGSSGNSGGFVVVRYNSNGGLDNSFGNNGIVTTPLGSAGGSAQSVAIQSDGKIVVAGNSWDGTENDHALARYNPDGSMDNTFGTNGLIIINNENSDDLFYSLAIIATGPDAGKIVAAGKLGDKIAVARFNPNGSPDFTFGTNGLITTSIGSSFEYGNSIAIQDDGKILVATLSNNNNTKIDFAIVRYNPNGILDNTFGVNGVAITPIGSGSVARSVVVQDDGKIIAAGFSWNGDRYESLVIRYNTDGTLDSTFGNGGIETTQIGSSSNIPLSAAIQPAENGDKKIVIGGYSLSTNSFVFSLARYTLNEVTASESYEVLDETPSEYILKQNYPNPFNPNTIFEFQIAEFGLVTFKIYDVLGKEIATLVNEDKPAGSYEIEFTVGHDSSPDIASGIYFYQLKVGNEFIDTKKFVLLK